MGFKHSQPCMAVTILYLSSMAQSGTHLDKPWFRWSGGKVPFFFQVSVSNDDRTMIRHMMRQIEARGGLLHEMFHMFGVMHTQMRTDRDKYINVYKNNVQRFYRREYDICSECNDHGVPYDCSSIMHYGAETFSTGNWTMRPKKKSCDLRWVGSAFDGRGATKSDWLLLNRISKELCSGSSKKRPRKLRSD